MAVTGYNIGDTVYLKSSAKRGFLESYKITGAVMLQGITQYTIDIAPKPPTPRSVGDRYNVKLPYKILYFRESELIAFCDALDLIINYHTVQLTRYQNLYDSHCATGSEGGD